MIKLARLTITAPKGTADREMGNVMNVALDATGISMNEISLALSKDYHHNTHFGNWCLVPVLDNEKTKALADYFGRPLDFQHALLEASDLQQFAVGDKVRITSRNDWAMPYSGEGKVTEINAEQVAILAILKKGSGKGWRFKVWDEVTIEKV